MIESKKSVAFMLGHAEYYEKPKNPIFCYNLIFGLNKVGFNPKFV